MASFANSSLWNGNGGRDGEDDDRNIYNRQAIEEMLKMLTASVPPSERSATDEAQGYRLTDAAYRTIATVLDDLKRVKGELKKCETLTSRQKFELQVKGIEIEGLKRRICQLENEKRAGERGFTLPKGLSVKVLDDKLKLFEFKAEVAEKEIDRLKKELEEEVGKKSSVIDLLKDVYQAVIDLRLGFDNLLKQEWSSLLKCMVDMDLENRLTLIIARLEMSDDPGFDFGPCHSQIHTELKTMKIIIDKLAQIQKSKAEKKTQSDITKIPGTPPNEVDFFEPEVEVIEMDVRYLQSNPHSPLRSSSKSSKVDELPLPSSPSTSVSSSSSNEELPGPSGNENGRQVNKTKHKIKRSWANYGFFCDCGLEFRSMDHLQHHINGFSCRKRFPCTFGCGRSFSRASILKKHTQIKHNAHPGGPEIGFGDYGVDISSKLNDHHLKHHRTTEESTDVKNPVSSSVRPTPPSCLESFQGTASPQVLSAPVETSPPENIALQQPAKDASIMHSDATTPTSTSEHLMETDKSNTSPAPVADDLTDSSNFADELIRMAGPTDCLLHAPDETKRHLGAYCNCGQMCANTSALHHHIWYRNHQSKLMCTICHRTYPGNSYLNKHMSGSHKMVPVSYCEAPAPPSFNILQNLFGAVTGPFNQEHGSEETEQVETGRAREHQRQQDILCKNTDPTSTNPQASTNNTQKNAEERHGYVELVDLEPDLSSNFKTVIPSLSPLRFQCKCGKGFSQEKSLIAHIQERYNRKIFKCNWCELRFVEHSILKSHIRRFHKDVNYNKNFGCRQCGSAFFNQPQLIFHYKQVHRQSRSSSPSGSPSLE